MKFVYLFGVAMMLLCLSGCGKKPIKKIKHWQPITFNQTKNNVILSLKQISPTESKQLFNGVKLNPKDVVALQGTIFNNSASIVTFSGQDISLSLMPSQEVDELLIKRTRNFAYLIPIVPSFFVGSFVFGIAAIVGISYQPPMGLVYTGAAVATLFCYGIPLYCIGKVCVGDIDESALLIAQKQSIDGGKVIAPGQNSTFLLFVRPSDFESFTVNLHQGLTDLVFDITVDEIAIKRMRI